jgi:hypothetical protein
MALALLLMAAAWAGATTQRATRPGSEIHRSGLARGWSIVPSPNLGRTNSDLSGVAGFRVARGRSGKPDAWAVGPGLIERWNGRRWSRFSGAPVPNGAQFTLNAITEIPGTTPRKYWAVGFYSYGPDGRKALIEMWNGAKWVRVPGPAVAGSSSLDAVAAASPHNAWTVGSSDGGPLIEHWNGSVWVATGNGGALSNSELLAVGIAGPSDVWAAGYCFTDINCLTSVHVPLHSARRDNPPTVDLTLLEHWNGVKWTVDQHAPQNTGRLESVVVKASNSIWAVGYVANGYDNFHSTLIEHFNGGLWQNVTSPDAAVHKWFETLVSVADAGHGRLWAVGWFESPQGPRSLVERWNGTHWGIVPSSDPGGADPALAWVSVDASTGQAMAVGAQVLRWNGTRWNTMPNIDVGSNNSLTAVARVPGSSTAWVAGTFDRPTQSGALVERWNGNAWTVSAGPTLPAAQLDGIAASSTSHATTVGLYQPGSSPKGMVWRWNGANWSVVATPKHAMEWWESLTSADSLSANNIWVAGSWYGAAGTTPLVKHWTGSSWSVTNLPALSTGWQGRITAIASTSPTDVWAVGYEEKVGETLVLAYRWDGHTWTQVSTPNASPYDDLFGIDAISPMNAWAVGSSQSGSTTSVLIEHWNGATWNIVTAPSPSASQSELSSVTSFAPWDVWAVGDAKTGMGDRNLVEHWNGHSWSIVHVPTPGADSTLASVVALSRHHELWAAGKYTNASGINRTLMLHWEK